MLPDCRRILMCKRTHEGDPDPKTGRFGVYDCMGRVVDQDFDAVIGVGGIGAVAEREGVARLVNWIGIAPTALPQQSAVNAADLGTMSRW